MSTLPTPVRRVVSPVVRFLHHEAAGGMALLAATVVALLWANLGGGFYDDVWHAELAGTTLEHWVSDGLMALFFLVAGLEIRREVADGELSDLRTAALPVLAAVGGMVVPALVYVALTAGTPAVRGWAVPTATDIAFAVGVVTVLGSRVPLAARVFLLALAIADDIGAIVVIALFYGHGFSFGPLLAAVALVAAYGVLARTQVPWPVLAVLGLAAWWCVRESGVYATIAGVALGLLTPGAPGAAEGRAERLEHLLHPWTVFAVLPAFALANAGLRFSGDLFGDALGSRVAWGVAAGLVVGKPLGVLAAAALAVRAGWARLPDGVRWIDVAGIAAVAGIGFTVSLFVTTLAFGDSATGREATVGIFAGSLLAGGLGAALLARRPQGSTPPPDVRDPVTDVGA